MRARLRDGRLALRLLVCDLDDGHGGGLLVVLGDLEADGLAVDGIGRHGGDFLDGVLAGLEALRDRDLPGAVGREGVDGAVGVVGVGEAHGGAGRVEHLELEAGKGHGVAGLGVGLDDLDAAVERLVDDGVVLRGAVHEIVGRDAPVVHMVEAFGHRGIDLADRVAGRVVGHGAGDAGVALARAEPRARRVVGLGIGGGGLVAGCRVLGGGEAGIVGRQGSDDLLGGVRDDLELDARGGVSLAVVGLPAVVLAALGLGDLDIERDGVFGEIVLGLKFEYAFCTRVVTTNSVFMHGGI